MTQAIEGHGYFERRYAYDSLGNLSLEIRDGETTKYSVDGLNRLVRKETGGKEGYSYAYDQRGNLVQETDEMNKKIIGSYEYDETNRMVRGRNESGGERIYRYNGLGVLVHKNGEERRDYVMDYTAYVPRPLIETGEGGINNSYAYDGRNRAWGKMGVGEERAICCYHNDRLGSTVKVTDSAGKIQAMANYDEWGSRTKVKVAQVGGMALDLAASYTGHDWDEALGMYHAKARMYDPGNKRFTAEDTHWNVSNMIYGDRLRQVNGIKLPNDMAIMQNANHYAYCIGNPLKFLDLTGDDAIWLTDGEGAGFIPGMPFGHSSILVQDEDGTWYHVNFGPSGNGKNKAEFIVRELDNNNIVIEDSQIYSIKEGGYTQKEIKQNSSAAKYYSVERYLDSEKDTAIYIEGDFTASLQKAKEYLEEPPSYWLLTTNCAWVALEILQASTEGETYNKIDNYLWFDVPKNPMDPYYNPDTVKRERTMIPNLSEADIRRLFEE